MLFCVFSDNNSLLYNINVVLKNRLGYICMKCTTGYHLWYKIVFMVGLGGSRYKPKKMGPRTEPWGTAQDRMGVQDTDTKIQSRAFEVSVEKKKGIS